MGKVYLKIWQLAKPFYERGRSYDIPHIEWMMEKAETIAAFEGLDKQIILPIVILHDVGYSVVKQENPAIKDKVTKIAHMRAGAQIAAEILNKVGYRQELIKKIAYCISVHDNWVLGDDSPYKESKEMAVFTDLDFLWTTTSFDIFKTQANSMGYAPKKFYELWQKDEKLSRRPFCCDYTRQMFIDSMGKIGRIINP